MKKLFVVAILSLLVSSCAWFSKSPDKSMEEMNAAEERRLLEAENFVADGVAFHMAGNDSMAAKSWEKALEIIPQDAEIHNFYGISLHRLNNIDGALSEFDKAVELNPKYFEAYNNRGYMLFLMNRYDESLSAFHKSLEVNPHYEPAIRNVKLTENIMKGNLSRKAFELSEAAAKVDDYAEQIRKYREVLKIDSTYSKAHNNIAVAYYYEDFADSAYYHLEKAIEYQKNYSEAINNLGYLYKVDENYDIAIELFLKALTLKPRYIGALNNLGETYTLNGEFENAKRVFSTVLDLEPDNEVAKKWLAVLHVKVE